MAQVPETVLQAPEPPLTGCDAVRAEIAKYRGWDTTIMFAIAQAENRTCDSLNHNLTISEDHGVCIGSYGVLQVGCLHYRTHEDFNDLATNVAIAFRVWEDREKWGNGYEAWSVYSSGKYKLFLN